MLQVPLIVNDNALLLLKGQMQMQGRVLNNQLVWSPPQLAEPPAPDQEERAGTIQSQSSG